MKSQIGVMGLAVMGRGLALNLAEHGFKVSGYNGNKERLDSFVNEGLESGYDVEGYNDLESFADSLERPRKIIMLIKADAVDDVMLNLLNYLEPGDILIDGGNSFYLNTERRAKHCAAHNVIYFGLGVSGGEVGARRGPSLMPGGDRNVYDLELKKFLEAISAKAGDNGDEPCCTYIGPGGAGHFVKMSHNGIEYGDMQLICESYYLMRRLFGMEAGEIGEVFKEWNKGELDSYLIEITAEILGTTDEETGRPMVDVILGRAGAKGTGMWMSQEALKYHVPLPTITQAVFARDISALTVKGNYSIKSSETPEITTEDIRRALYASKIISYAQGFHLMKVASDANNWQLDLGAIAKIFRGGCIIRAKFLNDIAAAFTRDENLENIMFDEFFGGKLEEYTESWRKVCACAIENEIAVPCFSSSLAYYDAMRDKVGPLNLLQAQRDYFGAHTFERADKEGIFHRNWND